MSLWVIKIGTSLLRGDNLLPTRKVIENYCSYIAEAKKKGHKIIIVSSGAVGLGCSLLKIKNRPTDITSLQAIAAIGQGHLMGLYKESMNNYGLHVAQILLTRSELGSQLSYRNATKTLQRLIDWEVIPIVNENDTVSNEELRYGDNDTLSALVAGAVSADQLILLTDIDRLYSSDPKINKSAKPITDVHNHKELQGLEMNSSQEGQWGTGGIKTKLSAARIATERGICVQLADGRDPMNLSNMLNGSRGGTVFHPSPKPIGNKKSWLAYAIKPVGSLQLDEGACLAIEEQGASLLLVGIKSIEGSFNANQPVNILTSEGKEIARGICSLSSNDISNAIDNHLTSMKSHVVIHRDVLVLTKSLVD
tara:strand:- start:20255 stop:21349 length:1095 start_codon:yes stop_codon:yes gene_type:complete